MAAATLLCAHWLAFALAAFPFQLLQYLLSALAFAIALHQHQRAAVQPAAAEAALTRAASSGD